MSRATTNILMIISFLICIQSVLSLKLAKAKGEYSAQRSTIMAPKRIIEVSSPKKNEAGKCKKEVRETVSIRERKHFEKGPLLVGLDRSLINKLHPC